MGGVVSDLLEETSHLGVLGPKTRPGIPLDTHKPKTRPREVEDVPVNADRSRRRARKSAEVAGRSVMPPCTKGHHRMCRPQVTRRSSSEYYQQTRPLTFGERLERIYQLDDPSMVQRSSTPTGHGSRPGQSANTALAEEEDEYGAWTAYLRTPGTFRGQMKPDLPGAFSGMCFPGSDPRWICHHQQQMKDHGAVVVRSIIVN